MNAAGVGGISLWLVIARHAMVRYLRTAVILVLVLNGAAIAAGLDDLATVVDRTSHRASSHDPTGGNKDYAVNLEPKATLKLLETGGPGRITHMWFTAARFQFHDTFLRDLVIRIYWEKSAVPSVEAPLGDFFALGLAKWYKVNSLPITVGENPVAMNCYWPMPFYSHARVELYNNGRQSIRKIYYNIDYELGEIPANQALFHAVFRKARLQTQVHEGNTTGKDNYVILETEGRGHYVGCLFSVDAEPCIWWGEGDDMIFIDHSEKPVIIGTGAEDYFCNAWGFHANASHLFYGSPFVENRPDNRRYNIAYRWHIPDPVRFKKHIRVTLERTFDPDLVHEYTSVAYWYQTEPIKPREPLPYAEANHPRRMAPNGISGPELEAVLLSKGVRARAITTDQPDEGFEKGGYLQIDTRGDALVEIPVAVLEDGLYQGKVRPADRSIDGQVRIGLKGGEMKNVAKASVHQKDVAYVDLGAARSKDKTLTILVGGDRMVGIDYIRIERIGE